MFVDFNILNQLGSPSINSNTFANRPAAGQTGRLFVSTDTFEIYRDNGTTWDLIGGPGSSTITGTGTATQVAYFTSSQAIGSSANLFWDNTNTRLGIGTATPGARLDIHGTGTIQTNNSTGSTNNNYFEFQRAGANVWRIGDTYNSGSNFFGLFNHTISTNAIAVLAATNKTEFTAVQTYTTGLARGNYFDYNLSVSAGGSFSSPNAITALGASLDLTLAGSATIPSGARSGLDAYNSISFTGAGTLTHNQGSQIRAYSNITAGWAFNGSATGTITHLAGLRALFPDNTGSAINVTNNYALLLNDQTPNTGTVTYTNRWGVYQEGASDLNYMAANLLLGSTTNSGEKLQVTGAAIFSSSVQATTISIGISPQTDKLFVYNASGTNTGLTIQQDGSGDIFRANGNSGANRFSISQAGAATFSSSVTSSNSGGTYFNAANTVGGFAKLEISPNATSTATLSFTNSILITGGAATFSSTIQATGVNIGTASPVGKLSSINTGNANTPSNSAIWLSSSATAAADGLGISSSALLGYKWIQSYDGALALNPAGNNVLIGTTTDAGQKLQVSGDIYTFNSVGGGVTTLATGAAPSIEVSNGNGYFKTYKYTFMGDNFNEYFFSSNAVGGDAIGIRATIKEDGTNCQVQIGDMTAFANATTIAIIDSSQTISFNGLHYNYSNMPQYANNAAALAGGLTFGDIYKITGTGDLKIVI